METKNVKIEEEVWKELSKQKIEESLNKISRAIEANLDIYKRFNNEKEFRKWFKKNFNLFGFKKIIEERQCSAGSPDFIMFDGINNLKVELETLSSHFYLHRHDPKEVDLVLCLFIDKKIEGVKTIEIPFFDYSKIKQNPTVKVSKQLKKKLDSLGNKGDTYEDIIWRLIMEASKNDI